MTERDFSPVEEDGFAGVAEKDQIESICGAIRRIANATVRLPKRRLASVPQGRAT
jgi:hypothetical protein